jgi:benzoyl-CoA reductase/2-hydroxyglutaryl-CoA dehydratase subunit BcrC/BadD/HgdB
MDENTVNRTKAALNALIDIDQLWIENTPNYNLSTQELVILKKRLERAMENVSRIYEENKVKMQAAEDEIKKMHEGKKRT